MTADSVTRADDLKFNLAEVVRPFPTKDSPESSDYMSDLAAAFDDQTNTTVSFAFSIAGPEAHVTWSQSLADGIKKYSDVVEEASRKEEHLYAVFAALLNAKKAKIRDLQEEASSPTTAKKKKEVHSPPSTMQVDPPSKAPETEDGDFASVPQLSTKGLVEKLSKHSPRKPMTARTRKSLPPAVIGEKISLDDLE